MKRARKRLRGAAGVGVASLPLLLPSPNTEPKVNIDPSNDGTYIQGNEIFSDRPLGRSALAHERGHALDEQRFSDADRDVIRRKLRIKDPQPWWGDGRDLGPLAGTPSPAEIFADYYAALSTGFDPIKKRKDGITIADTSQAYTQIGARKLKRIQKWLDGWARRQGHNNVLR